MDIITIDVKTIFSLLNFFNFIMLIMLVFYTLSTRFDKFLLYYIIGKILQLCGYLIIYYARNNHEFIFKIGDFFQFFGFIIETYCIIVIGKKSFEKFSKIYFPISALIIIIFITISSFSTSIEIKRIILSLLEILFLFTAGNVLLFYNNDTRLKKISGIFFIIISFPHFLIIFDLIFYKLNLYLIDPIFKRDVFFLFAFIKTIFSTVVYLFLHREILYLELKNAATKDYLTGIYNRREFFLLANTLLNVMIRQKNPVSILMLDLDKFKNINDTFGHHTGDKVIINFSKTVEKLIRKQDIFGRYGGEEFIIFLPCTSIKEASKIADRIRLKIEKISIKSNQQIPQYTVSIGVASTVPDNTDILEKIIQTADKALYEAKQKGRNIVIAK